jgi:N-dimethylarginine dimethylaminohydrolase
MARDNPQSTWHRRRPFMGTNDPLLAEQAYLNLQREVPGEPEPPFEDPSMMSKVWGRNWGVNNDVGRLQVVLVSRPGVEWEPLLTEGEYHDSARAWIDPDKMWYWCDEQRPDIPKAQKQHDSLIQVLEDEGVEVVHLKGVLPHMTQSMFTRDPAIVVNHGAVLGRLGPRHRRGEELPFARTLSRLGVPILNTIQGTGILEGGSFAWLNSKTAALAVSHRTNSEGAAQLARVLERQGAELLCIQNHSYSHHIDGSLVMVDVDLALAISRDLPWWFLQRLEDLGISIIEPDPREGAFGVNCLAVRPGRIIMSAHAEITAEKLLAAGKEVVLIEYDEIHKKGGGVHCSTLPLIREPL